MKQLLSVAALALLLIGCECTDVCKNVDAEESCAPGTPGDFKKTVKDRVFFNFDSAKLPEGTQATVDAQAGWLKVYPATKATVEGYCDERGTREYNLALGARRAAAVETALTKAGVAKDRLSTVSYGKDKPIVAGSTEEAYAQNRVAVTAIN